MIERRNYVGLKPRNKKSTIIDHSMRVGFYAVCIGEMLGYDQNKLNILKLIGKLHDVGKIYVLDDILLKTNKLDNNEKKFMENHTIMGALLLEEMDIFYPNFSFIVKSHHESYDGSGYPTGLKREEIPIEARIIAVADTFDAMTSPRTYNKPFLLEDAVNELKSCRGNQLDPILVDLFIDYIEDNKDIINDVIFSARINKPLPEVK